MSELNISIEGERNRRKIKKSTNVSKYQTTNVLDKANIFLDMIENDDEHNVPNCSKPIRNNEIFDTLSDVSTDNSDIEITHESTVIMPKKSIDSDACRKKEKANNSLHYLQSPPICVIKQLNNYLTLNDQIDDDGSLTDSDDSEDDDSSKKMMLDNGDYFILDGVCAAVETKKDANDGTNEHVKGKRKRKSQKRFPDNLELRNEKRMFKYWGQRYDLFERFDMGIKLDRESWFSVTPEYVAKEHADLCGETDIVLDGFCGAGGNTIQFAYRCKKVYAIDIDAAKVALTKNNCHVYGIDSDRVTVMQDNYHHFCSLFDSDKPPNTILSLPDIDVVFLSPPWGGQDYLMADDSKTVFDLDSIEMEKLMASARLVRPKMIIVYLPRNTDTDQLHAFARPTESVTIRKHLARHSDKKVKAISAIYK